MDKLKEREQLGEAVRKVMTRAVVEKLTKEMAEGKRIETFIIRYVGANMGHGVGLRADVRL